MANALNLNFLKYFAILGIMPYISMQEQQHQRLQYSNQQRYRIRRSNGSHYPFLLWQQIYTVTIIVGISILTLYGVIHIPFGDTSIISDLVSIILFVIHFIAITVILVETMLSYEKHFKLLTNYAEIQQLLKQLLQTQLCAQTIRQRQRRKYIFYVASGFGCLLVTIIVIMHIEYNGYFWHALILVVILRARCLQMLVLMDFIFNYLEILNFKLKALISCKICKNYHYHDVDYHHVESYGYMENLKFVYTKIFMLHRRFNDLYGISLLALLSCIGLDILIHVYWSFLTLMEFYKMHVMYLTVATLIPLFITLLMLCCVADDCEKQCHLILTSLKHLVKPTISCQQTADYNALLQDFIMQIIHNPIRISANNYFTINLKFLMGIFANIVTYLVILLQFRKTSNAKVSAIANDFMSNDTNTTTADMMIANL